MKKLLLLSALALGAMSASAQSFGDYFKVTFEGKEVANGETIKVTAPEFPDDMWGDAWAAHIGVINLENEYRPIYGEAVYVQPATKSLLSSEEGATAQICFSGAYGGLGNCLGNGTEYMLGSTFVNIAEAGTDTFEWAVDLNYNENSIHMKEGVTMQLNMLAAEGDATGDCEEIPGTEFSVTIVFGEGSGVDAIGAESGVAEYYNMQGMRVANPEKGLYIVKQGGKVTKRVF